MKVYERERTLWTGERPMKVYKLTDELGQTLGATQWGEGVVHKASGDGELCGPGWLHCYLHPVLAVIVNPIHAGFENPQLWEAEAAGLLKHDRGLKLGCTELRTLRRIPLPVVSMGKCTEFAIRCCLRACGSPAWVSWARNWLDGSDRSIRAARAAGAMVLYGDPGSYAADAAALIAAAQGDYDAAVVCHVAYAVQATARAARMGLPEFVAILRECGIEGGFQP